ncbi:MAG: GNAT family N-acetyltransferase [Candidatus Ratteibacteria bacterium]|nr:GNAT family N-acetyltransferase [Candidatus Ratteibacteria bacterium]
MKTSPKKKVFEFFNPGKLVDKELELILIERIPANPKQCFVPAYRFEMKHTATGSIMGSIRLRIGNTEFIQKYAGNIGYDVKLEFRGNKYAARSCNLILPLAKKHNINPVWITCNPDNIASRRTCEIIGAKYVETIPLPEDTDMYKKGDRFRCRYRIDFDPLS